MTQIPTLAQVMSLTSGVSSSTAFSNDECFVLYAVLACLQPTDTFLEIGMQLGRSSSIALQLQKAIGFRSVHCDPYTDQPDYHLQWKLMAESTGAKYEHLMFNSDHLEDYYFAPYKLRPSVIFIDGDHTYPVVRGDMDIALRMLTPDGAILCHDYGNPGLPDVNQAANEIEATGKVKRVALVDSLLVWRRA